MSKVSGRDPSGQAGRATHGASISVESPPSGDHPSRFWRLLNWLERALGSSLLLIVCYAVVSKKFIEAAGFQFDEWLLCLIIFINLSTKLEQVHAQAIEAQRAGTTEIGPVEDESAVAESDAHNKDRS
jgi:hypothetical protein